MSFMGLLTTGLGFLSGIDGLITGNAAEKNAENAEEAAIRSLTTAQDQQYLSTQGAGIEELEGLTGRLNASLRTGARALGSAEAGAGVYNSSAVAGAVANEAAADAGAESAYSTNLATTLANLKARNDAQAAQMQAGFAANNLNYARQLSAGGVNGMSSALSSIGQMNFGRTAANPNVPGNGNMNQGGFPTPPVIDPTGQAPNVNPTAWGMPLSNGSVPYGGNAVA